MKRSVLAAAVIGALLVGCGSAGKHAKVVPATATAVTALQAQSAALEQAVRTAVSSNARLSNWVLWHNAIPSWASRSTRGPALAGMRSAAAQRKRGDLQVRVLDQHVHINSVQLDPSYLVATVTVTERTQVRPYRHGRSLGRPRTLIEHAWMTLHRQGSTGRQFVVWRVGAAK